MDTNFERCGFPNLAEAIGRSTGSPPVQLNSSKQTNLEDQTQHKAPSNRPLGVSRTAATGEEPKKVSQPAHSVCPLSYRASESRPRVAISFDHMIGFWGSGRGFVLWSEGLHYRLRLVFLRLLFQVANGRKSSGENFPCIFRIQTAYQSPSSFYLVVGHEGFEIRRSPLIQQNDGVPSMPDALPPFAGSRSFCSAEPWQILRRTCVRRRTCNFKLRHYPSWSMT